MAPTKRHHNVDSLVHFDQSRISRGFLVAVAASAALVAIAVYEVVAARQCFVIVQQAAGRLALDSNGVGRRAGPDRGRVGLDGVPYDWRQGTAKGRRQTSLKLLRPEDSAGRAATGYTQSSVLPGKCLW